MRRGLSQGTCPRAHRALQFFAYSAASPAQTRVWDQAGHHQNFQSRSAPATLQCSAETLFSDPALSYHSAFIALARPRNPWSAYASALLHYSLTST